MLNDSLLNWFDLTILAIVLISAIVSLFRGFAKEAISLSSWLIALVVAVQAYAIVAEFLESFIAHELFRNGVAFFGTFLICLISCAVLGRLIDSSISNANLGGINRGLGFLLGGIKGLMISTALVFLLSLTPFTKEPWWQQSTLTPPVQQLASTIKTRWVDPQSSYL